VLARPSDPAHWADALAGILRDPEAAAARADAARRHARTALSRERMVHDYALLFEQLVRGPK